MDNNSQFCGGVYVDTALRTLKEISAYTGYCEAKIKRLIKEENFPAAKIGQGRYESDKILIDRWRRRKIEQAVGDY